MRKVRAAGILITAAGLIACQTAVPPPRPDFAPAVKACSAPAARWPEWTRAERRTVAECWIWHHQYLHDACGELLQVGNGDSVRALIYSLKLEPERDTAHRCVDALKKITGQNPGETAQEWESWWKKTGHEAIPDPAAAAPARPATSAD